MTDEEPLVPGIDVTKPSVARIYDYWPGGKVPPGVCGASQWVAGTGGVPSGRPAYPLVAAAVKTGD